MRETPLAVRHRRRPHPARRLQGGLAQAPGLVPQPARPPRGRGDRRRGRSGRYRAREAEGEERARLWEEVNDLYAGYETYQGRAGARRIPVMVLERVP